MVMAKFHSSLALGKIERLLYDFFVDSPAMRLYIAKWLLDKVGVASPHIKNKLQLGESIVKC